MRTRHYQLTVLGCALSWLLVGMHLPTLHEMIDHGRAPRWDVLAATALLAVAACAALWTLLRHPARRARVADDAA